MEPTNGRPKEWLLHPLLQLAWGVPLALLGVMLLMGDDPTFGAFVLLVGLLSVPMAISVGVTGRWLRGDLGELSLVDHPFNRFDGFIWGAAAAVFLGLGFAEDSGLALFAGALLGLLTVADFVIHMIARRHRAVR
jgi:hypothetical protein